MIPDKYNHLTQSVEEVVRFSQGFDFPLPGTADLISIWRESKARFYDLFGEKLIWQSPDKVTIELTDDMKKSLTDAFITRACTIIEDEGEESVDFLEWVADNRASFFENRVIEPLPQTPMKVGSKLLKSFKYFFDGDLLRELQDLASQFIQQSKIEGYLCLSIHPLDYLTASENNSNWRSCHALDGEYRGGNLSYMLDKTTIICYLRAEGDVQLNLLPEGMLWNDKKWRMFMSINEKDEIVFFSRQYPFSCDYLLRFILRRTPICELEFSDVRYDGFKNICLGDSEQITPLDHNFLLYRYDNVIIDMRDICSGEKEALNYNDLIWSPSYTPVFAVKNRNYWRQSDEPPIQRFKTCVGVGVPCLCGCGRLIDDSNMFLSDECFATLVDGELGHCVDCGEPIYEGDDYDELPNGDLVCCMCADERVHEREEDDYEED